MKLSLSTENAAATLRPRHSSLVHTSANRLGITADALSLQSLHDLDASTHRVASDDSSCFATPDSSFDSPPELPSPPIPPRHVPPQRPPPPQLYATASNHSTSYRSPNQSHSLLTTSSSPTPGTSNLTNTCNYHHQSASLLHSTAHCPPAKPSRALSSRGSGFESDFADADPSSFALNAIYRSPAALHSSADASNDRRFGRVEEVCVRDLDGFRLFIKTNE